MYKGEEEKYQNNSYHSLLMIIVNRDYRFSDKTQRVLLKKLNIKHMTSSEHTLGSHIEVASPYPIKGHSSNHNLGKDDLTWRVLQQSYNLTIPIFNWKKIKSLKSQTIKLIKRQTHFKDTIKWEWQTLIDCQITKVPWILWHISLRQLSLNKRV